MFTYFHDNKLKYNRGQLAPFFIVMLVVILIMAMVTVNLSKVAMTKTNSANAADAGSLAAGSAMANVFNSIASQNAEMEKAYWTFFTSVSVLFVIAITGLSVGMAYACSPTPCVAATAVGIARAALFGISIASLFFSIAQAYQYSIIRERIAKKGRKSAIKNGHGFVFSNSGTGSMLIQGYPPDSISDEKGRNNYRETYKGFLDNTIANNPWYIYDWRDGQGRLHSVKSTVLIDPVDTFKMQVTALPSPAEMALMLTAGVTAWMAFNILIPGCACGGPCTVIACASAIPLLITALISTTAAWAGLLPGFVITDSGSFLNSLLFTYCWIDDIEHNRLVDVYVDQIHKGGDLGLWQTKYPDIHTFSRTDFRGMGQIHPPVLRHDASIIAIEATPKPIATCDDALNLAKELESQIKTLQDSADELDKQADEVSRMTLSEDQIKQMVQEIIDGLKAKGVTIDFPVPATQQEFVDALKAQAEKQRKAAVDKEDELKRLKDEHPECF